MDKPKPHMNFFAQAMQDWEDEVARERWRLREAASNHAVFNKMTLDEKVRLVAASREVFSVLTDEFTTYNIRKLALQRLRLALKPADEVIV
jgi:hypothetical protein